MITGSMNSTEAAICRFHSTPRCARGELLQPDAQASRSSGCSPCRAGAGRSRSSSRGTGTSATATIAGFASFTTTCHMICSSFAAVHARRVDELLGIVQEELSQQEDRERVTEERGHDQRLQRTDPVQLDEDQVQGHDRHLRGQHHRRDHQQEDRALTAPLDARQRVGDRDRRQHDADRSPGPRTRPCSCAYEQHRLLSEEVRVVAPPDGCGHQVAGERLVLGHQRREDDEHERQQEQHREADRDAVGRDGGEEAAAPSGRGFGGAPADRATNGRPRRLAPLTGTRLGRRPIGSSS